MQSLFFLQISPYDLPFPERKKPSSLVAPGGEEFRRRRLSFDEVGLLKHAYYYQFPLCVAKKSALKYF